MGQLLGQIGQLFNYIITLPIFNVLMLLYHLFGSMAFSIIVLTLIVRLALFPLTLRQLRSTKATQAIQPLIADVRKKYKDQKEQYAAMQAIYKEYGVNPVAGCLPLLIQLPILYGLFFALREGLNTTNLNTLNQAIYPFLPKFTELPSPYMIWFGGPINLGQPDPTHILPIVAALATFCQLRMSQPRTRSNTKDAMTQQMAVMQFIMPFVTLFFAWTFPAGLALYWTTTSVFSMVQQYFVTGWGSLAVMPDFLQNIFPSRESKNGGGSKSSSGDKRKETQSVPKTVDSTAEVVGSNGHSENGTKSNTSANGSSSARRRSRNNSASARRRGNTPKRNVSHS
ncbi:MAG TPA: YidC/Oxa1 family membrane protein insertase [Ktedonobacteraceae bacterium]|nr:YidC/Oxa1 family membrane protein insertase [Ktedonobacteraceae bacterium]